MSYKIAKFELCPADTGAIVLDKLNILEGWRTARRIFKEKGYSGKYLLLENYNSSGNTIVYRINI